jgi:hypothetical protein
MGEQPYNRVLVINSEPTFDHLPRLLCEQQSMGWARDAAECAMLANKIRRHVSGLGTTLAPAAAPATPTLFGRGFVDILFPVDHRLGDSRKSVSRRWCSAARLF